MMSLFLLAWSNPGSRSGVDGRYRLESVNGKPLPFTVDDGLSEKEELLSADLKLDRAGQLVVSYDFRLTTKAIGLVEIETTADTGTYVADAERLTINVPECQPCMAAIGRRTITWILSFGRDTLVFRLAK